MKPDSHRDGSVLYINVWRWGLNVIERDDVFGSAGGETLKTAGAFPPKKTAGILEMPGVSKTPMPDAESLLQPSPG